MAFRNKNIKALGKVPAWQVLERFLRVAEDGETLEFCRGGVWVAAPYCLDKDIPSPWAFEVITEAFITSKDKSKRQKEMHWNHEVQQGWFSLQGKEDELTPQQRHWWKQNYVFKTDHKIPMYEGSGCRVVDKDTLRALCHREEVYKVISYCHKNKDGSHNSRDNTWRHIGKMFGSRIPKDLVAEYVRYCPHCHKSRAKNLQETPYTIDELFHEVQQNINSPAKMWNISHVPATLHPLLRGVKYVE